MNPINRIAITIVRMVASGFLVVGLLNLMVYWFKTHRDHESMAVGRTLWLGIPLIIGLILFAQGSKIAARINDFLDQ